jgi:hypothetical protein
VINNSGNYFTPVLNQVFMNCTDCINYLPTLPVIEYSYVRDGSQSCNGSYHLPYVVYKDEFNVVQTIYLDECFDICDSFFASSILTTRYVTDCPVNYITVRNDAESSPECYNSVTVTVTPNVNVKVSITSSFVGGATYNFGLPIVPSVTNVYSNLSNNTVLAGDVKKYSFGISAFRYMSGVGNIYTSKITITVKDTVDDSVLESYDFVRTHINVQC